MNFKYIPIYLAILSITGVAKADDDTTNLDAVTVFGRGQTRQVNTLNQTELAKNPAGSSPIKALETLPGVNFQSADAAGAYEWSTKISIRGFSQNQLGFTLDDIPLGDMSYRNHNGLHISRAIISENVKRVLLSQGTGALETASTSNLGGTIQFYSLDPEDAQGFRFDQTLGEDSASRTFLRFDSGQLYGGTKLALSAVDQRADKWKGDGQQRQQQFNVKLVDNFAHGKLSSFINYSDRREVDYQDLSKEMIGRLGYRWDNYYPDWNAALRSANGSWSRGETSSDDAYYAGSGIRKDWLGGATLDTSLSASLNLKTTLYHHTDDGVSLWYTPYVASSATVPVSLRTVEYGINRNGGLSTLSFDTGTHSISTGIWYENNRFDQAMRFYSQADGASSPYEVPTDAFLTRWSYRFNTNTWQFHLKDTWNLADKWALNYGFKSLSSGSSIKTLSGAEKSGSIKAQKAFLPQIAAKYRLSESHELFADIAQNMRAYKASAMEDSPFATTAAGFVSTKDSLKPETSITYELGWRYQHAGLETSLTAYHVDFRNRLVDIQQGSAIVGNPTVLANVGRVKTNGIEVGLTSRLSQAWSWYNAASLNDSRYQEDFVDNGSLIAVSSKQVVDSPRMIANSRLSYDTGAWFGNIGVNYVGKRYYTYLNDNSVSAYSLWNLGAGYRQKPGGLLKEYELRLNVTNLLDKEYVASIGTNGFVTSDPTGTAQTLLVGSPRTVSLTFSGKF
jgi:iron complex outermembrane receptor protein